MEDVWGYRFHNSRHVHQIQDTASKALKRFLYKFLMFSIPALTWFVPFILYYGNRWAPSEDVHQTQRRVTRHCNFLSYFMISKTRTYILLLEKKKDFLRQNAPDNPQQEKLNFVMILRQLLKYCRTYFFLCFVMIMTQNPSVYAGREQWCGVWG